MFRGAGMYVNPDLKPMLFAGCLVLAACALPVFAQSTTAAAVRESAVTSDPAAIPDAPAPQTDLAMLNGESDGPEQSAQAATSPAQPGSQPAASGQSSSSSTAQPPTGTQSEHQQAEQQLKAEEKQRVLGVVPNFNTTYDWNAASLSAGQKLQLAFHSSIDPFTFAAAGIVAGLHEALDEDTGFGWGAEGYGKRAGAAYLDAADGDMIGNGILPALLHQDPRYFRMGHGSFHHRLFYAIASSYICRHDNTGKWEPNYSNVGGNIIAGAISNLYYPSQNSGWGETISNGLIVTTEGTLGGVFQEFWPDVSRKVLHRDPTHGRDAQAAAEDKARKKAEQ